MIRALDGLDSLLTTRIYPLAAADDPPETGFVDFAESSFNGIHANDFTLLRRGQHDRPGGTRRLPRSRTAGQLAAIGIVHGQPFAPDPHRATILDQAARIGAGLARTLLYRPRDRGRVHLRRRSWKTAFIGGSHEFIVNGVRLLDCRSDDALRRHRHHSGDDPRRRRRRIAVRVTPPRTPTVTRSTEARTTRSRCPAAIPVKTFWAIDIYDTQTRSLLQTDNPYPSVNNRFTDVHAEGNGDVDHQLRTRTADRHPTSTGCGPSPARAGSRSCASTAHSKPWFDKTWRLGEIQQS